MYNTPCYQYSYFPTHVLYLHNIIQNKKCFLRVLINFINNFYTSIFHETTIMSVRKPNWLPSTLIPNLMVNFRLNSRQMNSSPSFFPVLEWRPSSPWEDRGKIRMASPLGKEMIVVPPCHITVFSNTSYPELQSQFRSWMFLLKIF